LTNINILPILKKKENMSRLTEIKKQYPELNITIIDLFNKIDGTKSYKYLPLLCKIFGQRFSPKIYSKDELLTVESDHKSVLMTYGIPTDGISFNETYAIRDILELFNRSDIQTFIQFKDLMEKGVIENKDITSYKDIEELGGAITLSMIKENEKELEGQAIKVFEDEKWLAVRPLTFQASSKYGSGTKWCTTYKREKNYFEKYWRTGILVYFINKKTGYKFGGFKELDKGGELSFWNSADSRVDYVELETDDYLLPIVRKIFKSEDTNKNLCSNEIQEQVHTECINKYDELFLVQDQTEQPTALDDTAMRIANEIAQEVDREIVHRLIDVVRNPTMRA
jgi:hypothetical protein